MKKNKIISLVTVIGLFLLTLPAKAEKTLDNPLGKDRGLLDLYGDITKALVGFTGVLAFMFFIIGGITLLTSAGNPEKVKKGQQMLVWAVIGIIVVFSSYIIIRVVLETVIGAAGV